MKEKVIKGKRKGKLWKKVLLVLGVILLLLLLLGTAAFFYLRENMGMIQVKLGAPDDQTVVATTAGEVRGYISEGIYTYHGIPYAEAKERFVLAEEVTPWEGVRDAVSYGETSPQAAILGGGANISENGSNACQNLNLWSPGIGDGKKRPVMVWLHGGGMSSGSGNSAQCDGTNLAKYGDVVVASVNHRLNVYGFLDLSAYGEKYRYSANAGLDDLVKALTWLEENVEAFGGDPENITVFGQSGGGAKVLALMSSPYAKGHFQKGIVQSGATETLGASFTTAEVSAYLTGQILAELGITADNIEDIQRVDNASLQAAATKGLQVTAEHFEIPQALGNGYAMEWECVVEGDYLPTQPIALEAFTETGFDVPLLIGSNLHEWAVMGGQRHKVNEDVKEAFKKAYPNQSVRSAGNTDTLLRKPLLQIMRHKAVQGGAPVFAYVFTHPVWPLGSFHGAEIPYVFHNGGDAALQDTISSAWVSFARDGVPSADALPEWEAYTVEDGATMILDTESYLAYHHDIELMKLLDPEYVLWVE